MTADVLWPRRLGVLAVAVLAGALIGFALAVAVAEPRIDDAYQRGRTDVCHELAAAGFPVGGASSLSPEGVDERTGC